MGALVRENVAMADGFFQHTKENLMKIVPVIRKYQPEIILANALSDRHPDHGRAAKLTADACFLAGLIKIETKDEQGRLQDRWRPKAVYHYIQDHNLKPDFVIDISPYIERKMEVIMAFKSQFFNVDSKELSSPISNKEFLEFIKAKARVYGRPAGFEFAEGYNVSRCPGVKDLFDLV